MYWKSCNSKATMKHSLDRTSGNCSRSDYTNTASMACVVSKLGICGQSAMFLSVAMNRRGISKRDLLLGQIVPRFARAASNSALRITLFVGSRGLSLRYLAPKDFGLCGIDVGGRGGTIGMLAHNNSQEADLVDYRG